MKTLTVIIAAALSSWAAARTLEEIRRDGHLRACHTESKDIATYLDTAVDPRVARLFGQELGLKVQFVQIQWNDQFEDANGRVRKDATYVPAPLASGKCDVYTAELTSLPWRIKKFNIVTMYPSRLMVLVRTGELSAYKTLDALAGKTAAAIRNTTYHEWIEQHNRTLFKSNPIKVLLTPGDGSISQEELLESGKVDFILKDTYPALAYTGKDNSMLSLAFPVGPTDKIGWGFRHSDKKLADAFHQFFEKNAAWRGSKLNQIYREFYGINLEQMSELTYLVTKAN